MNEQLEILRRIADRLKAVAESPPVESGYLDMANHLLAEIQVYIPLAYVAMRGK